MLEPAANDGHVHITSRHPGARSAAADLLAEMDSAGVRRTAVVTPSTLGWDNSITFDAVAAAPDRFVAIARVDLRAADAIDALRGVISQGARGLRITLFSEVDLAWLSGARMEEAAAVLAEHRIAAEFHCEPGQLPAVGGFAARHPEVSILVDHLGRPAPGTLGGQEHRLFLALADLPNVFAKSPALGYFSREPFPHADVAPFIVSAIEEFGADRIMWGSDWPGCYEFGSYRRTLDGMVEALAGRDETDRRAVLSGTFDRLFGSAQ